MKNGDKDLITVIVPIYKVEQYLNRCVASIIGQTYQNLEIILVDDGSPDNCPVLCDDWANIDERIRVIHKQNGGLSDARNVGIDASRGAWIAFVDSDDYLEPNMYERLLDEAIQSKADMAVCNYCLQYETYSKSLESAPKENKTYSNLEYLNIFFTQKPVESTVAWNKLYKRSLFFSDDYIRYPVNRLHEDEFTTYKLIYLTKRVRVVSDVLYHYVQRENSIMSSFSKKNLQDTIAAVREYKTWSEKNHLNIEKQLTCANDAVFLSLYLREKENANLDPQGKLLKQFRAYIIKNGSSIWLDSNYQIKKRIFDLVIIYYGYRILKEKFLKKN